MTTNIAAEQRKQQNHNCTNQSNGSPWPQHIPTCYFISCSAQNTGRTSLRLRSKSVCTNTSAASCANKREFCCKSEACQITSTFLHNYTRRLPFRMLFESRRQTHQNGSMKLFRQTTVSHGNVDSARFPSAHPTHLTSEVTFKTKLNTTRRCLSRTNSGGCWSDMELNLMSDICLRSNTSFSAVAAPQLAGSSRRFTSWGLRPMLYACAAPQLTRWIGGWKPPLRSHRRLEALETTATITIRLTHPPMNSSRQVSHLLSPLSRCIRRASIR